MKDKHMSTGATYVNWAFTVEDLTPLEQLVLLRLAYYADHLKICRPSINRLVEETGASRSTVFRAISAMEGRGVIRRLEGMATTVYELLTENKSVRRRAVVAPSQGSHLETGGVTGRPDPISSSSTYGTSIELLHPSDEGRSAHLDKKKKISRRKRSKNPHTKARTVFPNGGVRKGWAAFHEWQAHSTPRWKEEDDMEIGKLEDLEPAKEPKRRQRPQVEDTSHLASLGSVGPKKPKESPKSNHWREKPLPEWTAHQFSSYFRHLAQLNVPMKVYGYVDGWAMSDFRKWLDLETDPSVIKLLIEDFFSDEANLRNIPRNIWSSFRVFFHAGLERAEERVRYNTPPTPQTSAESPSERRETAASSTTALSRNVSWIPTDDRIYEIRLANEAKAAAEAARRQAELDEQERLAGIELAELEKEYGL